ncbi:MAG: HNH endonuclease, partial [Euzebyales bacterium]|nr:HNH endonuclease [Euzebyales bacterium]
VVLFDGARPLAVSKKVRAAAIPADTRLAVHARDRGCRFPGSADPLAHCDLHHIERQRGGDHHPDNLVAVSRRHHTLIHRHGWTLSLNHASGQITAWRGRRRWRSLPRGTRWHGHPSAAARRSRIPSGPSKPAIEPRRQHRGAHRWARLRVGQTRPSGPDPSTRASFVAPRDALWQRYSDAGRRRCAAENR